MVKNFLKKIFKKCSLKECLLIFAIVALVYLIYNNLKLNEGYNNYTNNTTANAINSTFGVNKVLVYKPDNICDNLVDLDEKFNNAKQRVKDLYIINDYCNKQNEDIPSQANTENTACTNNTDEKLVTESKNCEFLKADDFPGDINVLCKNNDSWVENNYCQQTCYYLELGYEGDKC